ncbi:glutathione S-transferase [Methylobacillus sp. MM3]|jgi:glutathione S-transferase|uniref:glutathione S-transferase N-terminal domain-containing protein n=1 Tax=Methylobacillus sp. MM3 TaxID=1848039 RepID=UPI0007E2895F|nr:glutathione S-transferase N-terminal domain-containing protein [Methylobacillus sp. MM3]OAJ69393.1 glutathione S-transferase [Methylobacillus sp. MM3]
MKLFITPTSPYARKVRVVLAEKHIECELVTVPSLAAPDSPVPAYNPLGKVPTLVLDDGTSYYDSVVIVDYLDHKTPVARLIPQDNSHRALVRRWEALADGVCDAAVAAVMEKRRPPEKQDESIIERQILKVTRGLRVMSEDMGEEKWTAGDRFTLADIATGCVLGYLDLRMPELGWREQYPNLAQLYEQMMARPSFRDSAPPAA